MFDSVRSLLALLLDIGATRLELATTELEEERLRLVGLLISAAITLMLLGMAVVMCTAFVVVAMWDSHRLLALTAFTVLFLTLAGVAVWQVRTRLHQGSQLFAASLAELQQDRDALQS